MQKISFKVFLISVLFIIAIAGCTSKADTDKPSADTVVNNDSTGAAAPKQESDASLLKLEGKWVNEAYVKNLKDTKSTAIPSDISHIPAFEISKEDGKYKYMEIYDFHEGVTGNIIDVVNIPEKKQYKLTWKSDDVLGEKENLISFGKSDTRITMTFIPASSSSKRAVSYRFIKISENDFESFINNTVLAGTYKDDNGKTYTFNKDASAVWPDNSFKYKIAPDQNNALYLIDASGKSLNKWYHYEFKSGKLNLYNAKASDGGDNIQADSKPFAVLQKIK